MKTIKPVKVIMALNTDGTMKELLYQYKVEIDGVTQNKYFTMNIISVAQDTDVNDLLNNALNYVTQQEGE